MKRIHLCKFNKCVWCVLYGIWYARGGGGEWGISPPGWKSPKISRCTVFCGQVGKRRNQVFIHPFPVLIFCTINFKDKNRLLLRKLGIIWSFCFYEFLNHSIQYSVYWEIFIVSKYIVLNILGHPFYCFFSALIYINLYLSWYFCISCLFFLRHKIRIFVMGLT